MKGNEQDYKSTPRSETVATEKPGSLYNIVRAFSNIVRKRKGGVQG